MIIDKTQVVGIVIHIRIRRVFSAGYCFFDSFHYPVWSFLYKLSTFPIYHMVCFPGIVCDGRLPPIKRSLSTCLWRHYVSSLLLEHSQCISEEIHLSSEYINSIKYIKFLLAQMEMFTIMSRLRVLTGLFQNGCHENYTLVIQYQ